jgi:rhamnosyltransferase
LLKISVIIPVKNGAATIQRCLHSIFNQTIAPEIEVIIIDSGSSDNSIEIVKEFSVTVINIDTASFNHGETRNLGVHHAAGSIIYFTVQDACLAEDNMLEKMLEHFKDENIQAVCGKQAVPHEANKNPVMWYNPVSKNGIQLLHFSSPGLFDQLSPQQKIGLCGWDDVNAMYRKSALLTIPFEKCDFGEDMLWCKAALRHGFTLMIDTGIVTWHYHFITYRYQFKVKLAVGYIQYREFDFLPAYPPVLEYIKFVAGKLAKQSAVSIPAKVYWFFHNLSILIADLMATRQIRRAASTRGIKGVELLYESKCNKQIMGRLKGQRSTG